MADKPEQVKILGLDYTISYKDQMDNAGECYADLEQINILNALSSNAKKSTILHEIIEALVHGLDMKMEHHNICLLETGLLTVMRENPDLIDWLKQ